jgi:hypothetical protein
LSEGKLGFARFFGGGPYNQNMVIWILFAMAAIRSTTAAELVYFSGAVTVEGKAGVKGQKLSEGQTLRTGTEAAALVALDDGSRLKLNPESEVRLDHFQATTELSLERGAVFSEVRKQTGSRQFLVRTKAAVMGVRGTKFFAGFGKEKGGGADLWMCVNEGRVEVQSPGKKVSVGAGEGVFVPAGKETTAPRPYAWTRGLNWNMQPEKGELIDRTHIEYKDLLERNYD